jgi:hypothetical protein
MLSFYIYQWWSWKGHHHTNFRALYQMPLLMLSSEVCASTLLIILHKIGKAYSLEYTDIRQMFFTPHHVGHCCTKVTQRIVVQRFPTMTSGHSCTNVAPRIVEA